LRSCPDSSCPTSTDKVGALGSDRLCCPAVHRYVRPHPTPFRLSAISRLAVIRAGCSRTAMPGAGEGLSSSRHHLPNVPRPLRRGVPRRCTSRYFTPSMAFALILRARLPLVPFGLVLRRGRLRLNAADRSVASSKEAVDAGLRRQAFPPDAASLLPGSLVTTWTGLAPAGGDELTDRAFRLTRLTSSVLPARVLWTRSTRTIRRCSC